LIHGFSNSYDAKELGKKNLPPVCDCSCAGVKKKVDDYATLHSKIELPLLWLEAMPL